MSRRTRTRLAPLAVLALLLALFFAPLAVPGRAFVFRDLVVYAAGQDAVLRESLVAQHALPAKNPYTYLGVAELADPSTQTLYPIRVLLTLLFEPPRSLDLLIVIHFAIAAASAYRLGRALGARRAAAFAGAATYALSGPLLSLEENPPLLAGAAFLPLALALALEARRREGPRRTWRLALAGGAIALAVLGGDLQGAVWASALVVPVAGIALLQKSKTRARAALEALFPPAIAFALAGVLLLPAWRLLPETDRTDQTPESAGRWSLAPARAVELVVPFPFGVTFPDGQNVTAGLDPGTTITEPWCETLHAGAIGLVLGAAALADAKRRRRALALVGLGVLGYLLALGPRLGPAAPWRILRGIVPFYAIFRHPEKHAVLVALALSGLAALGVDALASEPGRRRGARALVGAGVVGGLGFLLLRSPIDTALAEITTASRRPHASALAPGLERALDWQVALTAVAFVLAGALLTTIRRKRIAIAFAAALVAIDVGVALRPRLFLGDASLYDERPLGADLVRGKPWRLLRWPWSVGENVGFVASAEAMPGRGSRERAVAARVLSWSGTVAARERVQAVQGFSSFVPRAVSTSLPRAHFPDPVSLDTLGVRWLVLDERLAHAHGLAVVASSTTGVALVDRGERVPRAPEPSFQGDVPGLGFGAIVSLAGLAAIAGIGLSLRKRRGVAPKATPV